MVAAHQGVWNQGGMSRDFRSGSLSATERDARRRQVLLTNRTPIRDRSACVGACWPFSPTRRMTMQDNEASVAASLRRGPWNKGKLVGAKPPLRPKHVWSTRTKLQVADRRSQARPGDVQSCNRQQAARLRCRCPQGGRHCAARGSQMMLKWLFASVVLYGGLVALLYVVQRYLQYFPERQRTNPS